ncbi:hypothetical protein [Epilithonimonas hominis]|uniref:Lipoprotein n=1 Tax=Epilithonimonas hominis TaxID=420404 RepID=A0A1H6JWA8_9FLAO|nr:hypothetical protein [Epilithonimonas hominis]SEH66886.1 hypothetical protein SAMN05421793_1197 [Epilithonimonas hominis]
MINYSRFNYVFALMSLLLLFSCEKTLRSSSSVSEAKEAVDGFVNQYQNSYNKLCSKSRNDALKEEFRELAGYVSGLNGCGEKAVKLSYDEQYEIDNYAQKKLYEHPDLRMLLQGQINCW